MNIGWSKKLLFFILVFFIVGNTHGQTSISGIINDYTKVKALNTTCNSLTVSSTTGFNIGAKVLLIQMKGATVTATGSGFGAISAIGNAGNYEFNEILDIQGMIIYLKYTLLKTYNPVGLQLVTIPQYAAVTITGTLTAHPWDDSTGGVLVFESSDMVTFNADINVEGLGFKGGDRSPASTYNACNDPGGGNNYYIAANTVAFGNKGESISEFIAGKEAAQNNQANGGGGGHSNNSGGGGGSNYGAGGRGGRKAKGCSIVASPWGLGGVSLTTNYTTDKKIFAGGGGGGGHQNNYTAPGPPNAAGATPGNPGGGIVIIKAVSLTGNSHRILAGGFNGNCLIANTLTGYFAGSNYKKAWGDSGGGGGGGGSVLLSTTSGYNGSTLNVDVRGGRGDSVFTEVNTDLGPGGGGGGGVLWVNDATLSSNITATYSGGPTGLSYHPSIATVCQCSYQAIAGSNGAVLNNLAIPESNTIFNPPCTTVPVTLLSFSGKEKNGKIYIKWSTVTEINNDHFVLEKSSDGIHYEFLTSIKGNGNTNEVNSYSYTDYAPVAGNNYYRLKQYDYDGKEHLDGHALVAYSGNGEIIGKVYPNPFSNELTIQAQFSLTEEKPEITIFNLLGAEVSSILPVYEDQTIILNTSTLSRGIYLLKISALGKTEIRKIIKE